MYTPLKITTDYSLLKSLIKIDDLINFLVKKNITACAICDDNLYGVLEFYTKCKNNNIKPIIGLSVYIDDNNIYLYAKNYSGYKNLLKLHSILHSRDLLLSDLGEFKENIVCIVPYQSKDLLHELDFDDIYIGYSNDFEKRNSKLLNKKCVYVNNIRTLDINDIKYMQYLDLLAEREKQNYNVAYYKDKTDLIDVNEINDFVSQIDLEIPYGNRYMPKYCDNSFAFLKKLAFKGLEKRLNGALKKEYIERLNYELEVIQKMNFEDYFLIVYDYVLYAKKNKILVGCRGSAAGALLSYVIGITDVDPLKYNLVFERFLNPARVTMPDIDIDFDASKREQVINYVKEKYGVKRVASGLTFNSLKAKLVLRELAKVLKVDNNLFESFIKNIDSSINLNENAKIEIVRRYLNNYKELRNLYTIALKLEGIKKNVSTHAAGVVISSVELDEVIPLCIKDNQIITGVTMEHLEEIGLLKMDFLGVKNLTTIANVLNRAGIETLNKINLNDSRVLNLFVENNLEGIFQFETPVMRNLLEKFKVDSFSDLVAAVALVRPGPRDYAESFIKRKKGLEKIEYLHPDLKSILSETNGILLYQEQIISILVKIGGYSAGEADIIRRAISKKKDEIIMSERTKFVSKAMAKGYSKVISEKIYDQISKFASFGFNKSHSVVYALISYQMAYLKTYYPAYFILELLKDSKGEKIYHYLNELKKYNIKIIKPSIFNKNLDFEIKNNNLIMPLNIIKGINSEITRKIISVNQEGFGDYFDFLNKTKDFLNGALLKTLIYAGALDSFMLSKKTMINNLDAGFNYVSLIGDDEDDSLVKKPNLVEYEEYSSEELRKFELEYYDFYIGNHPSSKYNDKNIMKIKDMKNNLFKKVKMVIEINKIRKIKTKKNEDMAFIVGSDETGSADFTLFPKNIKLIDNISTNDLVLIYGEVVKRFDKYQIIINNIEK